MAVKFRTPRGGDPASPAGSPVVPDTHAGNRQRLELVRDREQFLEELCARHRAVAHLGCTDSPYTLGRLATNRLLHTHIVGRTHVTGFDIDEEALELLRRALPNESFVCVDIAHDVPREHRGVYDLVLAGEVLEHVDNVGAFLRGCHALLSTQGLLCVTVPNACSPKIGVRALFGRESVHPDHRVYFGPRTLSRTLEATGFSTQCLATYLAEPGPRGLIFNPWLRILHRLFKGPVGEGLIALAHAK